MSPALDRYIEGTICTTLALQVELTCLISDADTKRHASLPLGLQGPLSLDTLPACRPHQPPPSLSSVYCMKLVRVATCGDEGSSVGRDDSVTITQEGTAAAVEEGTGVKVDDATGEAPVGGGAGGRYK